MQDLLTGNVRVTQLLDTWWQEVSTSPTIHVANIFMNIKAIQEQIRKGTYRYSDHTAKLMIKRAIDLHEVEEVILNGEIIEEYPLDKYAPSCLIYCR